jgi:predicted AlkP superfamily pyrophosphatase or phosphodiesterase
MKGKTAGLVALLALVTGACASQVRPTEQQSVVLVSIDALKPEYLDSFPLPNLRALAARGARARWMQPATPTLTFPNHYTIVTGLHPARHGIVNNTMVDPADSARFALGDTLAVSSSRWWGGEPIWVTAERQGVRAASFFWPGSEAPIAGRRPTFWKRFDDAFPNAARVDTVLTWLARIDTLRPRMVTLYFSTVDHESHDFGPWSPQARAAAIAVDSMIGRLVEGLERRGLARTVNVVVVADHGMSYTPPERRVVLDDYFPSDSLGIVTLSPFLSVGTRTGDVANTVARLQRVPHLTVFPRESTPPHWRYEGNPRIPPIVGVMDEGWTLMRRGRAAPPLGNHGYDAAAPSMRAAFIAAGPAIAAGLVVEPFQNVHVYELMCAILGLRPAPNDGSLDSLRAILR